MVCASTEKCIHIYVCLNNRMHTWMYSFHRCPSIWFSLYHPSRFFSTDSELLCFWNPYTEECTCAFLSIHERVLYFRKEALYICKRAPYTHAHTQPACEHTQTQTQANFIYPEKCKKKSAKLHSQQNPTLTHKLHQSVSVHKRKQKRVLSIHKRVLCIRNRAPYTHIHTANLRAHTNIKQKTLFMCARPFPNI